MYRVGCQDLIESPITHTRLLEMIVEAAAQVTSARAASLFLVEEATQELVLRWRLARKPRRLKNSAGRVRGAGHRCVGSLAKRRMIDRYRQQFCGTPYQCAGN